MAKLDKQTIEELTKLSRIGCTEQERVSLMSDLKTILDYVDQLQEIDTDTVAPCNHVLQGMANVMREDVVGASMPREVFLANAPSQIGGMIRVPPVLKSS